jgi:F-type H+-transporting ATPase subunit epsilon
VLHARRDEGGLIVATFVMQLKDSTRTEHIDDVESFVGEDSSGSFGIEAGHARLMTSLTFGLARFRTTGADWRYLALPSALLYFRRNELVLSTRHYLIDEDYTRITAAMAEQLIAEEERLKAMKTSLRRMEEEALKRMWRLGRKPD